jgi:hypothetical protein
MSFKKILWSIVAVLAVAGGLVHLLQPLGFNLLGVFSSWAGYIQFAAGASILALSIPKIGKMF